MASKGMGQGKKAMHAKKIERVLNCLPSREREKDWRLDDAQGAGLAEAPPKLPTSVGLRDDTWWKNGDQGNTGSCSIGVSV